MSSSPVNSMYVSDGTNVYASDSEGYPTMSEACQNPFPISGDMYAPVGQCGGTTTENFQIFTKDYSHNVLIAVIILLLVGLLGFGGYKLYTRKST